MKKTQPKSRDWEQQARRIVKVELVRRGISYRDLVAALSVIGVQESEQAIANKMSRGTFRFTFVLQCMAALNIPFLNLKLTPPVT
jgi:hypothetical protein